MSPLVRSEILRLFINPLTSHTKYSRHKTGNLQQLLQMQVSQKQNNFCEFSVAFLECV